MGEHDRDTGAVLCEYIWLGDMLLALATGTAPQYAYMHTGQFGDR